MLDPIFRIAGIEDAVYKQLDDLLWGWIPELIFRQYERVGILFCIPVDLQDIEIFAECGGLLGGILLAELKIRPVVDAPSYLLERLPVHPEDVPFIVTVCLSFERNPFELLSIERDIGQSGGQLTAHNSRDSRGS